MRCRWGSYQRRATSSSAGQPAGRFDEIRPMLGCRRRRLDLVERRHSVSPLGQAIEHSRGGRRPGSGQQLHDAKAGDAVARIFRPTQQGQQILDMRRLEKLQTAKFHERNIVPGQFHFQRPRMMRRAEQNRLRLQCEPLLAAFENFLHHITRLVGLVAHADQIRPLARFPTGPQVLGETLFGQFDHSICRRQDRLGRAIVLVERHDVGARHEMTGKIEDVAHCRGAKRIDRLGIVSYDGQSSPVRTQGQQHRGLKLVGVLIFIDQHMVETRRDIAGDRGLLHHMGPIEQKVIVIEHMLLLLDLDITGEKGLQLGLPHLAPGKIKIQNLLERLLAIDRA